MSALWHALQSWTDWIEGLLFLAAPKTFTFFWSLSLFRPQVPFLQTTGWQGRAVNALSYNTSQVGAALPLVYGTPRVQMLLGALGNFQGPNGGGKKGKGVGPLPLGGSNTIGGKGGGGSKKGGKLGKGQGGNYSVDVLFLHCQGPITFNANNLVFANASVETYGATQGNFYVGADGQAADPTFSGLGSGINYSGKSYSTYTPLNLGPTPALPNLSFELNGLGFTTGGPSFPVDANPGFVVTDSLTNPRYGTGFPVANLDQLLPNGTNTFGDYCQAAGLLTSFSLDQTEKALNWLDGYLKLLNSAPVWSGELLKIIPYGDLSLSNNGAAWAPILVPVYSLTDDDFIPWEERKDGIEQQPGAPPPIKVTRTNQADAVNWVDIQYTERGNFYNRTNLAVSDQGSIDQYGLRKGETLPGMCFCSSTSAQVSAQLVLQRSQYMRLAPYEFQLGWDKILAEPMDIVLLTGRAADEYLQQQPVRITKIAENENGDLTVSAEHIMVGSAAPPVAPKLMFDGAAGQQALGIGGTRPDGTFVVPSLSTNPLFTTKPNDVIVLFVQMFQVPAVAPNIPTVASIQTTSGLVFQPRGQTVTLNLVSQCCGLYGTPCYGVGQYFWAPAPQILTNEVITVTFTYIFPHGLTAAVVAAAAVNGCNINSPFDPAADLPKVATSNVSPNAPGMYPVEVTGVNTTQAGMLVGAGGGFNVGAFNAINLEPAQGAYGEWQQPFGGVSGGAVCAVYPSSQPLLNGTVTGIGRASLIPPGITQMECTNFIMFADNLVAA